MDWKSGGWIEKKERRGGKQRGMNGIYNNYILRTFGNESYFLDIVFVCFPFLIPGVLIGTKYVVLFYPIVHSIAVPIVR